jgi:hypothetical protein
MAHQGTGAPGGEAGDRLTDEARSRVWSRATPAGVRAGAIRGRANGTQGERDPWGVCCASRSTVGRSRPASVQSSADGATPPRRSSPANAPQFEAVYRTRPLRLVTWVPQRELTAISPRSKRRRFGRSHSSARLRGRRHVQFMAISLDAFRGGGVRGLADVRETGCWACGLGARPRVRGEDAFGLERCVERRAIGP